MIDQLQDVTFIIPIKIESADRLDNLEISFGYLSNNFDCKFIIHEMGQLSKETATSPLEEVPLVPDSIQNHPRVNYYFESGYVKEGSEEYMNYQEQWRQFNKASELEKLNLSTKPFHRTRMLNEMLAKVETPITVNYDADILLPLQSYITAAAKLREENLDMVYPFELGFSQKKITQDIRKLLKKKLETGADIRTLIDIVTNDESFAGHCQFINTNAYRALGMENENFISWGPEDKERYFRFKALGAKVAHLDQGEVYHLEHERLADSAIENIEYINNTILYLNFMKMRQDHIRTYYAQQPYLHKYNK